MEDREIRKVLLEKLIHLDSPLKKVMAELDSLGWDWDGDDLVNLTGENIISILERYLQADLTEQEVEDWANAVEMREDIEFGNNNDKITMDAIFELANPALEGELTPETARALIEKMQAVLGVAAVTKKMP